MKRGGFLLLALVVFSLYSDTAASVPDAATYCRGYPTHLSCKVEYVPHCGSNGKTTKNKCFFCKSHIASGGRLQLVKFGPC